MSHRYSLRFESGERAGEAVPITGPTFTIGRKPGNSLQIVEASVSGNHAELSVTGDRAILRDLGSTNGTKVGANKIDEAPVAAGDRVTIGHVAFTFVDEDLSGSAAPAAAPAETSTVSAENLARARRGARSSKLGLVAIGVLAVAGGGVWWWMNQGGGTQDRQRPVETVAGNLLTTNYSFEKVGGWTSTEELPGLFGASARARYSGETGLSASVGEGEGAEHVSDAVPCRDGQRYTAVARIRVSGDATARLGLRFLAKEDDGLTPGPAMIWSSPIGDSGWEEFDLAATVPGGYGEVQVVLRADVTPDGSGRVDVDDVSLVSAIGQPSATIGSSAFHLAGGNLTLSNIGTVLLSRAEVGDAAGVVPATIAASGGSAILTPARAGTWRLRCEAALIVGGVATLGADGYSGRSGEFEASGVSDVLLGEGQYLVRLNLGGETSVKARASGRALLLEIPLGAGVNPRIQLDFSEERKRVITLTAQAKEAESDGQLGRALRLWQTLLDEVPFEAHAVTEAQGRRAVLLQGGFALTRELAAEIERASFFRLVDIYRECRASAEGIAAVYQGSEIDEQAAELIAGIDADLVSLEAQLDRHEVGRLKAILTGLKAMDSKVLAAEVEGYLSKNYGGMD